MQRRAKEVFSAIEEVFAAYLPEGVHKHKALERISQQNKVLPVVVTKRLFSSKMDIDWEALRRLIGTFATMAIPSQHHYLGHTNAQQDLIDKAVDSARAVIHSRHPGRT